MTPFSPDSTRATQSLLEEHPFNDLRQLHVSVTLTEIEITGVVSTYYLKQMAQEAVRPALDGRRLRNRVTVIHPDRVKPVVSATDLLR